MYFLLMFLLSTSSFYKMIIKHMYSTITNIILILPSKVSSAHKPVTGLRLYLEGSKCNQLALHIQHLSSLPSMFSSSSSSLFSKWQSSEDSALGFIEPIQWKSYSRICTAAVKHNPKWFEKVSEGVFIVTGAQLVTKGKWLKKSLHLHLLFTHIPNCTIQKTEWAQTPSNSHKGSFFMNISSTLSSTFVGHRNTPSTKKETLTLNSGVFPVGPPESVQSKRLLRFVDMTEIVRGPNNVPGHWLVTAAKLGKEGGKIGLQVKFALLNFAVYQ